MVGYNRTKQPLRPDVGRALEHRGLRKELEARAAGHCLVALKSEDESCTTLACLVR